MFANPLALLLLAPIAAAWVLARRGGPAALARLPGGWRRLVEPAMRGWLARSAEGGGARRFGLVLATAALLSLAIARPIVEGGNPEDYANFAGRALVIDMSSPEDLPDHRLRARRLAELSTGVPVAVVAAASEAFTVAPLTTDPRYLDRYLLALSPEVMPVDGRSIATGIAHAEALLADAGTVDRRIVVFAAGPPPERPVRVAPSGTGRVVALAGGDAEAWEEAAGAWGARVRTGDDLAAIVAAHDRDIARRLGAGAPDAALDLGPWIAGLAALAWLGLFRRRTDG